MLHLQQGLCQAGERPQALKVPQAHALPLHKTYAASGWKKGVTQEEAAQ